VCRLFVELEQDDDELVYVCFCIYNIYICVCVRACSEIFFFCAFEQRDEDATVAAQGRSSRSRLFFDIYIYIFFEKKTRNGLLLMLKKRRRLLLLLSFFQCITMMPRFFLASTLLLSFSFHRLGFLFFSSLFFLTPFLSFFLLLSP